MADRLELFRPAPVRVDHAGDNSEKPQGYLNECVPSGRLVGWLFEVFTAGHAVKNWRRSKFGCVFCILHFGIVFDGSV